MPYVVACVDAVRVSRQRNNCDGDESGAQLRTMFTRNQALKQELCRPDGCEDEPNKREKHPVVILHLGERIQRRGKLGDYKPEQPEGDGIKNALPRRRPDGEDQRKEKEKPGHCLQFEAGKWSEIAVYVEMQWKE
jgi:hypothetical protein